jgi:transposase
VFFKDYSNNRALRKRVILLKKDPVIAETFQVSDNQLDMINYIFHQDPKERVSATFFSCILTISKECNKINLKSAPNPLLCNFTKENKKETMERISYATFSIGKGKEYSFEFKHNAVFAAQELGIKPAAKKFKIAINTMRSWLRRYNEKGKQGLEDQRQGPNHIPNKIPPELEEKIISIRTTIPCFGPKRIKYFYEMDCSLGAIQRVIRSAGLAKKRKKQHQKKRDLRELKAKRQSMTYLQMDVKHLYDIPNYWDQLKPLNLPKYQYTIRDVKSGMLFLGFSNELSELNARTMVDHVLDEIKLDLPFDIQQLTIQTDNGSEFSGNARRVETAPFVYSIEKIHGANHVYIRPGHCNANADVESVHELIETEFFDLTRFENRGDFFKKVESYRLYFNFVRPNFSKKTKTPVEICRNDWNTSLSYNFSLIKTIDLDKISILSHQRGQSIPVLPET